MARRIQLPIVVLWAVVLAGCGTPTNAEGRLVVDGQARPCVDEPVPSAEEFLQCPRAIRLTVLRLGLEPGDALALDFYRGEGCAEPAEQLPTDCGAVVAWFDSEPPVMVRILPYRSGGFAAQNPETPLQVFLDRGPAPTSLGTGTAREAS